MHKHVFFVPTVFTPASILILYLAIIAMSLNNIATAAPLNANDINKAKNDALNALKSFNPAQIIKDYTNNPPQTRLTPDENNNHLSSQGFNALTDNSAAQSIYQNAQTRPPIKNNPASLEMQYAAQLLDNADSVLDNGCYQEPSQCKTENITKTCDEFPTYKYFYCGETLNVQSSIVPHTVDRTYIYAGYAKIVTLDLTACRPYELCRITEIISLDKNCLALTVTAAQDGQHVAILKAPTCNDPTMTMQLASQATSDIQKTTVTISINEKVLGEVWTQDNCSAFSTKVQQGLCTLVAEKVCMDPNQTKIIDNIPVTKACWGSNNQYHCIDGLQSTCEPLLTQGCSQSNSICIRARNQRCEHFQQTFSCPTQICLPERSICPGKIPCADGACDNSKDEVSDDINEGISQLAALTGSAQEIAQNQIVNEHQAAAFAGHAQICKKYPLGLRDCCRSRGWGSWVIHCPKELQELLTAKHEHRAVYLGKYHKDLKTHYVYCVFPSKLTGIIQIQGRQAQLHIPFGDAQAPNCRGLSAHELSAINFSALNLSSLITDLRTKMQDPDFTAIAAKNQNHIEQLNQGNRAHD